MKTQTKKLTAALCLLVAFAIAAPATQAQHLRAPRSRSFDRLHGQDKGYNLNEIKSFVYKWFSLFDRNAPTDEFIARTVDQGLEMAFPERTLRSHNDFRDWYGGILENIKKASHDVSDLQVTQESPTQFAVSLRVHWQATTTTGEELSMHVRQEWTVIDDGGPSPRVKRYIVIADQDTDAPSQRTKRTQVICRHCQGKGFLHGGPGMYKYTCPTCKGQGYIDGHASPPGSTDH